MPWTATTSISARAPLARSRSMNAGSIGDRPPSTRKMWGFSAAIAGPASVVIAANRSHSGSISGSQWDLLLGSFQILTASITIPLPLARPERIDRISTVGTPGHAAQINFLFGMRQDFEPRTPQHCRCACGIGSPPVRRVPGIALLDEVQLGISGVIEMADLGEIIIRGDSNVRRAPPLRSEERRVGKARDQPCRT